VAKESSVKLTKFELEVMGALWALGSASVREIREQLPARKRPAYTTVQTIVYRLEEKGAVRRAKKIGNAHVFEAVVTRASTVRRLFGELLELFGGRRGTLMAQMVEAGHLTLEDLREAEDALSRIEADRRAGVESESESHKSETSKGARRGGSRERRRQ
jgi:BlaI family transcriptional regulator, penicillinase repressor